jgi:hypothetical protein
MSRARCRCDKRAPLIAALAFLVLSGCTSTADLGRLQSELVTDNIHAWVGRDAARSAGGPVSTYNLTDDERMLRDLAFPLIEPPYDRVRWDSVIYEYGINRSKREGFWIDNPVNYYAHLQESYHRSSAGRYNRLIDDIRNDTVRIDPFFEVARRVVSFDRQREVTMQRAADLTPAERANAQARVDENSLTIAWVAKSLSERCAGYRFALQHLAVAEPLPLAADADLVITELQQRIAANQVVVVAPRFAAVRAAFLVAK